MYSPELLAAYAARPAWKTWLAHSACILLLGLPYLLSKWSIGLHLWLWYQLCHPQHATALLVQVRSTNRPELGNATWAIHPSAGSQRLS